MGQTPDFLPCKYHLRIILWKNGLEYSEEGHTKQLQETVGGHINPYHIYDQTYIRKNTLSMTIQGREKANTKKTDVHKQE